MLIQHYDAAIAAGDISDSPSQRAVVCALDRVATALVRGKRVWWCPWRRKQVQGLYVYGPVGVGKTYVMDLFYQHVPLPQKARFHFHHFMQMIDAQLRRLQGVRDPLRQFAHAFAQSIRILCLDEFLVHDVADAMILAELLHVLLKQGVVLIATANTRPDDLYLYGVRRERFLPVIARIKHDCQIITLDDHHDHRLGRALQLEAYLTPLSEQVHGAFVRQFAVISPIFTVGGTLNIQNRAIACVQIGVRAVWFLFDVICSMPRSQLDYLEIAERFDTVFVSDILAIDPDDTVRAILLIHFVDVMYDQGVRLIVSAAVPPGDLYPKGAMCIPFKRTLSRLHEMQSEDYLQRHRRRS